MIDHVPAEINLVRGCENVPGMRSDFGRHNRSFPVTEIVREKIFQVNHFFFEASVGEGL